MSDEIRTTKSQPEISDVPEATQSRAHVLRTHSRSSKNRANLEEFVSNSNFDHTPVPDVLNEELEVAFIQGAHRPIEGLYELSEELTSSEKGSDSSNKADTDCLKLDCSECSKVPRTRKNGLSPDKSPNSQNKDVDNETTSGTSEFVGGATFQINNCNEYDIIGLSEAKKYLKSIFKHETDSSESDSALCATENENSYYPAKAEQERIASNVIPESKKSSSKSEDSATLDPKKSNESKENSSSETKTTRSGEIFEKNNKEVGLRCDLKSEIEVHENAITKPKKCEETSVYDKSNYESGKNIPFESEKNKETNLASEQTEDGIAMDAIIKQDKDKDVDHESVECVLPKSQNIDFDLSNSLQIEKSEKSFNASENVGVELESESSYRERSNCLNSSNDRYENFSVLDPEMFDKYFIESSTEKSGPDGDPEKSGPDGDPEKSGPDGDPERSGPEADPEAGASGDAFKIIPAQTSNFKSPNSIAEFIFQVFIGFMFSILFFCCLIIFAIHKRLVNRTG